MRRDTGGRNMRAGLLIAGVPASPSPCPWRPVTPAIRRRRREALPPRHFRFSGSAAQRYAAARLAISSDQTRLFAFNRFTNDGSREAHGHEVQRDSRGVQERYRKDSGLRDHGRRRNATGRSRKSCSRPTRRLQQEAVALRDRYETWSRFFPTSPTPATETSRSTTDEGSGTVAVIVDAALIPDSPVAPAAFAISAAK